MKMFVAIALFSLTIFESLALPGIIDFAVNPANGHQYYLLGRSNWTDAEAAAIALGGHLATVNDGAENTWIWNRFGPRELWIGYNDAAQEGTFVWASGELSTFTFWVPGEPNNGYGAEDYAYIRFDSNGRWNDAQNVSYINQAVYGVVEVVPEPSLASLALLFGFGFVARKRK